MWSKIVKWFGYKLHLIVDSAYELPVAYSVTKTSVPDINEAHDLLEKIEKERPSLLCQTEEMSGDKAYDDTRFIVKLWDNHRYTKYVERRRRNAFIGRS